MSKLLKTDLFNYTAKELSIKYKTTVGAIYHARKTALNPKIKSQKYVVNLLSKIDTEEKAYILGLLIADGTAGKYAIVLSLQRKDREILEKIHTILRLNNPIIDCEYLKKNNNKISYSSILSINSIVLCEKLLKYGLIPNKTHHTFFPDIPSNLYPHFIRGYFDGDGCIHIGKDNTLHIKIVGNFDLINKIQQIIVNDCNVSNTKIMHCAKAKANIVALQHGGNKKCKKILEYLYKDATIFMKRKHDIYKNFNLNNKIHTT